MDSSVVPADTSLNLKYASLIVAAYLSKNHVSYAEIHGLIRDVHSALVNLSSPTPVNTGPLKPAVPIKRSVTPDYVICLEDGKQLKMLKRHLRSRYHLTPDEYRARWNLPHDYPMVAPNYAARRSAFAKRIGLGRKTKLIAAPRRKRP
jgi:predicted transcriptional regulator